MKPFVFKQNITVPASAIDALNHVNNVTYLQWCLETAQAHWLAKTDANIREQYVWVVLNHFISYKNPSFINEELEVQTWIENYEHVKCKRYYKIIRLKDKKTIVEAQTLWCLLDAKTFRPTKITEEIAALFI